jgi:sugar fermentation stimulation protein A
MDFPAPLIPGRLLRRYQRFLADIELDDGQRITVHCPNTGAMTGCAEPGSRVWLSHSDRKTRKYPHTWELVETTAGLACIHSALANKVVLEAVHSQQVPLLNGYTKVSTEVKYGQGSRADLVLEGDSGRCVVEVKSVTLCLAGGEGAFPDAVSSRASKHLRELEAVARGGDRALLFFCVLHAGIRQVRAASEIDPAYAEALRSAMAGGVEAVAWQAQLSPVAVTLDRALPVVFT